MASFWSDAGKVFKAIGHGFEDVFDYIPKIITAIGDLKTEVPTLITDIQALLTAVEKMVVLAVGDARPVIAQIATLIGICVTAVKAGLLNISDDESALVAFETFYAAVKADITNSATAFMTALDGVVTAYDNVAAVIETAVAKVKADL